MTNVQMLVHITGGRADGSVWPAVGHEKPLKVSKAEAQDLYTAQLARPWPGGDEEEQTAEAAATAQTEALVEAAVPPVQWPPDEPTRMGAQAEPVAEADEPEAQDADAPKPAAPKADWVEWAVSQGADEEEANASTKQQLMEQYGARP
jgi:hypothetical protein